MTWSVFTVLMIFYLLAVFTFHASGSVHILPLVAVAILVIDHLFARRFKSN